MYKPPKNDDSTPAKHHNSDSDSDSHADEPKPPASTTQNTDYTRIYNKNDEIVEIFNCRIFSFDEIKMDELHKCKELILRKNLIHKLQPLPDHLAARLTVLDLFDNKIRKVADFFESHMVLDTPTPSADPEVSTTRVEGKGQDNGRKVEVEKKEENDLQQEKGRQVALNTHEEKLKEEDAAPGGKINTTTNKPAMIKKAVRIAFPNLVKLDLSYNQIRKISGLDSLSGTLKELYLVENKIKTISGLDALVNLELLELGGNQISQIGHSLDNLRSLKELWIGKNKISSLDDSLHQLHKLEKLSLQANRLTKIEPQNFPEGKLPNLREAFFSENGIQDIENIPFHAIQLLDFSMNPISVINDAVINKENMPDLAEFWLTDGKIKDWKEVEKFKPFEATLRTLYLERNPIEDHIRYRDLVYQHLPFLTQIDSWPIVNKGNLEADRTIQRRAQS